MKAVSSHNSANSRRGPAMTTLGLAVIEWLMLVCSIKARIFQQEPTAENLTMWCNATEVLDTRMERK